MSASETSDSGGIRGQGETLVYVTRWSMLPLVGWNLLAAPFYLLGVPMVLDSALRGKGLVFLAIALFISGLAYAAWIGRSVIVSNRRVIYHAALSRFVSAVPLDKIEHVRQEPGKITVRAGTVFNTLNLSVPQPEALAAAIEAARANLPATAQPSAPMPDFGTAKNKEPSRSEAVLGFLVLGVIGVGVILYNMPEPAGRGTVTDGARSLPVGSSVPKSSPATPAAPQADTATRAAAVEILCATIQQSAVDLAEARDRGVSESMALREFQRNSSDPWATELITIVIKLVYSNHHVPAQTMGVLAHQTCLKAWARQK